MEKISKFVDMAKSKEDLRKEASCMPCPVSDYDQPIYPWGLCLTFTEEELNKLDLDDDCEPGDMVHLHCIAKVTSVSKNDTTHGTKMNVSMQITHISAESEDEENEEAEEKMPRKLGPDRLYK